MKSIVKDVVFKFENCDESTFIALGDKLREIRNNRGISQSLLGEKTNRDRTGLSAYERGVKKPSLNGLYEIANALGYDLKITFEDKEMEKNMNLNREVFSEKFINEFLKNMVVYNKYENTFLFEGDCHKDKVWTLECKDTNKVSFKSELGSEIVLTSDWDNNSRYAPININVHGPREMDYKIYRDLDEVYSIQDMNDIRDIILECIAIEEAILCASFNKNNDTITNLVNIEKCSKLQSANYLQLKSKFKLKDEYILEIIEQTLPKYKFNRFLDVLNCSNDIDNLESNLFAEGISLIKDYADKGVININSAKYLVELAYLIRLQKAAFILENEAYNPDIAEAIINAKSCNLLRSGTKDKTLDDRIDDCIKQYAKEYSTIMMDEYEIDKNIGVIFSVIKAFYPYVNERYVKELIGIILQTCY